MKIFNCTCKKRLKHLCEQISDFFKIINWIEISISTLEPCRRRTCGKRVRSTLSFYFVTYVGLNNSKVRKCQRRHGKISKCYHPGISFVLAEMRFHVAMTLRPQTANPPWQWNFVRRIHDDTEASNDESNMILRPRTKNTRWHIDFRWRIHDDTGTTDEEFAMTLRLQTKNLRWYWDFRQSIHNDTETSDAESTMVRRFQTANPRVHWDFSRRIRDDTETSDEEFTMTLRLQMNNARWHWDFRWGFHDESATSDEESTMTLRPRRASRRQTRPEHEARGETQRGSDTPHLRHIDFKIVMFFFCSGNVLQSGSSNEIRAIS